MLITNYISDVRKFLRPYEFREGLKRMLGRHIAYSDASTLARSCVLSINKPSPDLFLVVRLDKVLQGDISECAESYLREDKNKDKVIKC